VWLRGYRRHRPSTVRQAEVHVKQIKAGFGPLPLAAVRPSHVEAWLAELKRSGLSNSYVYALHSRLAQVFRAAIRDGITARSPCSRDTSPGAGKQRAYVATTKQVWALHDVMPQRLRAAVLLGALAGLRVAEACGLRVTDVDFVAGMVHPLVQYPAEELKTETSQTAVPHSLARDLLAHAAQWPGETLLTGRDGGQLPPWALERAVRSARAKVPGLPEGFR
jgi:integrase